MGKLKPGATYIYEKSNGVTYAREFGSDPASRTAIGWDSTHTKVSDSLLWADLRETAKEHPPLQKILDNAIIMYRLIKDNPA